MKSTLFLTKKYLKTYLKRCLGVILCFSMFITALLTVIWYRNSVRNTVIQTTKRTEIINEIEIRLTVNNVVFIPVIIFFVLTVLIGLFFVSAYYFKEQEKTLRLLRCIGFSRKKAAKLLLVQSFFLWLCSMMVSVLLSMAVLWGIQFISSFSAQPLLLQFDIMPVVATAIFSTLILIISLSLLLRKFYRQSPVRQIVSSSKKTRKSQTNLKQCWHKAYGRKYRLQNIAFTMIVLLCTGITIFGSFVPLWNERGIANDPAYFPDDTDYSVHMISGNSGENSYYINFPLDSGIDKSAADEIISDQRVLVKEASVSHLCYPFFLTKNGSENKMLYHYVVEAKKEGYDFIFKKGRADEMIQLAGGNPQSHSLVQLPMKWVSSQSVQNCLKINGTFSAEEFQNGFSVIAPEHLCSVGDEFTMVIPIPDKDATEENIQGHVSFECRHLKVAATYQPKQDSDNEMILSLDYLFSVYPTLNYEELKLKNLAKSDSHYTGELEQKLRDISKLSSKNAFYNYAEMSKEFYDRVHLQMFQLIVSISILIVMIMTALVVSSDLRIRSDLSGYAVMRAVGADIGTVRTLILDEIKRQLIVGIVGGAACGSGVCFFFAAMTSNIKTGDIFLFYVLPVLAVTILLLYCGTCAAVKKLTAVLFHRSIIEMIGFTE